MRRTALLLAGLVLGLALIPTGVAHARSSIRVGIGDQQVGIFDQPLFQRAKFKRVRYFVPWNVMDDAGQLAAADAYVQRARAAGISVLLHVSSDNLVIKKAKLPSVDAYRKEMRRLVPHFRALGVKEFGTWNEENHASQPTYRSPARAASFFKVMYQAVKPHCASCAVIALDVLDQHGVDTYMRSFYRALSPTYRRRATLVGIHNYGDVNRRRTTYTKLMISQTRHYNRHTKFWITETGGIVKFGRAWPCSTSRAKSRLRNMFDLAKRYHGSGVQRLYIYNFTGAGCSARFDAGLTNPDGTARPGYTYVRSALRNFSR